VTPPGSLGVAGCRTGRSKVFPIKRPAGSGTIRRLDIQRGGIGTVTKRQALFSIVKPPRPRRVLLVEDDRDVRSIIALALRRVDIEVVEAETAEQARPRFDAADIDIVVTDIALPGDTNGLLLGEWLRICFGELPLV